MGNSNSTSSRSTRNITNTNRVYAQAINEYEISLQAATKAENEFKMGNIVMAGKGNTMNVNVQQNADVKNYIAASAAIESVLKSDSDSSTKVEALAALYNDSIQKGNIFSDNSAESVDETNINNSNIMEVYSKISNAINIVSTTVASNKTEIGNIIALDSAEDNVLNLNIQQEAKAFTSSVNELFEQYANDNHLDFKNVNDLETQSQNQSEQKDNLSNATDNVKDVVDKGIDTAGDTAKHGMDTISAPIKYIAYAVIAVIILIGLAVVYKLVFAKSGKSNGGRCCFRPYYRY